MTMIRGCVLALMLSGCASVDHSPTQTAEGWYAVRYAADSLWGEVCVATIGEGEYTRGTFVQDPGFYPFVERFGGDVWVGVRGGGLAPMPVGDVQLRIDGTHTWRIPAADTPAFFWPGADASDAAPEGKPAIERAMEPAKTLIPVTATRGDEARQMLAHMMRGDSVTIMHYGQNGVGSATQSFALDESLLVALDQCGIPFEIEEE